MDGQSGIFFQPTADVVPSRAHRLGAPTMSFHLVDAGPVAGDYLNVGVEEGFSNRLEFGFTRNNHTDGGDPAISPLFNFAGMNIFNVKAKLLPAGAHKLKYVPSVSVGGVLRTDDPFVVQSVQHQNATNGDFYGVATELFTFGTKFAFVANAVFAVPTRKNTATEGTPTIGRRVPLEVLVFRFQSRRQLWLRQPLRLIRSRAISNMFQRLTFQQTSSMRCEYPDTRISNGALTLGPDTWGVL